EARRLGLSLAPEAAEALRERVGTELTLLLNELEKLRSYLGPERVRVEAEDVATVVGRSAWEHSFAFIDAVLACNTPAALSVLQDLFVTGEAPQAILAQLAAQFRRVVTVKALGAENWPGAKLLRPLELGSAWAAEKVREQALGMSRDRAERALALILRTDYRLKHRRGLIPEVELQVLAAELCSPHQGRQ
ncbi:MAG TPA: DNA polymerase III subunit delta, partial [Firmicutes bacterium]|nr:DNA polymerase III subunit delta [Bacillota bacterium]